jgi:sugar (pentulose or hexulose) kinase
MMLPYYNGGRRVSRCVPVDGKIEGLNQGKLKENIIRALFESIAFITRAILNDFERITGTKYRQIRVSGGPTQNQPFMRILASILGRDVVLFKEVEAGLVGCAVCVAKGLGWYDSLQKTQNALVETSQIIKPDPTQTRMYESLCNQYLRRFANDIGLSPVTEQN